MHIPGALLARQQRLGARGKNAFQPSGLERDARGRAEAPRQAFGLIELAFAQLHRMQGHRHDPIPCPWVQLGFCPLNQKVGEKWFEPKGPMIFISVNSIQNDSASGDGGSGGVKMKVHLMAIGAFEGMSEISIERQTAAATIGRLNEPDFSTTRRTDEPVGDRGAFAAAELAGFRIKKCEHGPAPASKWAAIVHEGIPSCDAGEVA